MTSRALGPGMERGELMRGEEGELRPLQVEPLSPGSVASPGTVPWLLCLLPDELLAPRGARRAQPWFTPCGVKAMTGAKERNVPYRQ